MKERPILFSGPMVRAILEGQKTVTRRPVKPQYMEGPWSVRRTEAPRYDRHSHDWWLPTGSQPYAALPPCPYGQPGDRLWVREAWLADAQLDSIAPRDLSLGEPILYPADGSLRQTGCAMVSQGRGRPSIHMPRWASRILLEVTDVRVERLQDISEDQCIAEGIERCIPGCQSPYDGDGAPECDCMNLSYEESFQALWTSINGAKSWSSNPWVWVVEFKRIQP
ncbi:hypothetical protein [Pseudomonas sp. UBA6753]|uniref:hypothetical protein n=1 Tax=Pseudomonas sp. UBA6753 TaxID=1947336 RepID=UPI00257D8D04|nr:hypothetical protein [Pseudomonas sp. UBA6753]